MTQVIHLPGTLQQTIIGMHGDAGRAWLANLPRLVTFYAERWDCRFDDPFTNLSFNYVAPGRRADGTPVVLKLSCGTAEIEHELAAVRLAGGRGMIEMVAEDAANGAMLLRRALPGDTLIDHPDDEEAIHILARTMEALWQPSPPDHTFPTVANWGDGFRRMRERFDGGTGPLPTELTGRAERMYAAMLSTAEPPVVLHGDLHHHNVLRDGDGWSAIDPKGVVGERAYEVGALMRNRLPDLSDAEVGRAFLLRRLAIVAEETGLDIDRLRQWTIAQELLSAWWVIEDGGQFADPAMVGRTAELLIRDDD